MVDRMIGAGWASVHGPSDPRTALLWALDRGFHGLMVAPAPRVMEWEGLRVGVEKLPFKFGGVRVSSIADGESPAEGGLASANRGDRLASCAAVGQSVELARRLGAHRVVLDPGIVQVPGEVRHSDLGDRNADWSEDKARGLYARRGAQLNRAMDGLCRVLFELCKSFPDMTFCLSLSRNVLSLGEPGALSSIFEDLPRCRLGYWHDTVAAACREVFLGEDPCHALEVSSKYLQGMTLGDYGDGECYLPPGSGGVDYSLLSNYRHRTAKDFPVAVELDPGVDPGEIPGVHAILNKFGL